MTEGASGAHRQHYRLRDFDMYRLLQREQNSMRDISRVEALLETVVEFPGLLRVTETLPDESTRTGVDARRKSLSDNRFHLS
ncbi:MAG: hypothetical protein GY783_07330 [Gammaproteobacteria bacterium]|nr:hypothetical protein [Gammaproteobacteria bacterium]